MTSFSALASLLALLIFSAPHPGPLGEGSLASETAVLMSDGSLKSAADLVKGDKLRTWDNQKSAWTTGVVKAVTRSNARGFWTLKTATSLLRGSANLWCAASPANLVPLSELPTASQVFMQVGSFEVGKPPIPVSVTSLREYPANLTLFNIDLETPGLFVASGFLVHD